MQTDNEENRIIVEHVYKTFNIYMDKANSLKEKMLFWKRNRKEKRTARFLRWNRRRKIRGIAEVRRGVGKTFPRKISHISYSWKGFSPKSRILY